MAEARAAVPANTITDCSMRYPFTSDAVRVSPGDHVFLPSPAMIPLLYTLTHAVPLYTMNPVAVEYAHIPAEGEGIADDRAAVPANTITI